MPRVPHHWETIAHRWNHVGHPLRPCPADIENFTQLLAPSKGKPIRGLILGVTPELYRLVWPPGSTIQAVDRSMEMIKAIWPGSAESASTANWLDLPFPAEAFDFVICDGGLHLLEYPSSQQMLPAAIARVLKPGGHFAIRLFVLPESREDVSTVLADRKAGTIPNFHIFKLRMAMALQHSPESGVVLHRVYDTIMEECAGFEGLCAVAPWPQEEIRTLASYHESKDRYHFLTCKQSVDILSASGCLTLERKMESVYPLGERCPLVSFRKKELS